MTDETKLPLTSSDVTAEVLAQLREIAPQVFSEGRVDFEKLKATLGENIVPKDERYGLSWAGKSESFRNVQIPSVGTLIPQPEESVNFDTSENLIIEGDNLEVLKLLQKSYHGKVKMIYIDPPYNTGNEFIYPDKYHEGLGDYLKYSGQVNDEGQRNSSETDTSGRFHSKWLNMMYPRLFLARNLLSDDGVIFVSIDNNEVHNLRMLMNEVFGEESFVENIIWEKKSSAKGVPPRNMIVNVHEYIFAYQKSNNFKFSGEKRDEEKDGFKNSDNDPRGPWRESNIKSTTKSLDESFTIVDPNTGREYTNTWAFSKESLAKMIAEERILWKETLPKQKEYMLEMTNENKADALLEQFEGRQSGGFFFTRHDHETLIQRNKIGQDNATPAGNGIASQALLRLTILTGEMKYQAAAERCLKLFNPAMQQYACYHSSLCSALSDYLHPPGLLVLCGKPNETATWRAAVQKNYLPDLMTLVLPEESSGLPQPLDKPLSEQTTAWLCLGTQCLPPITSLDELIEQLGRC